jgi:hypothetical protein
MTVQPKKKGAWRRTAAAKGKEERMGAYGEKDYDEDEEDGGEDDEKEEQGGGAPWCRQSPAIGGGGEDGVLMAVACKANKLGYACFDEERSTIYVNELLGKSSKKRRAWGSVEGRKYLRRTYI